MPIFQYKAKKHTGEIETGVLEARDQDSLIHTLQERGLIVLSVSLKRQLGKEEFAYKIKLHSRIAAKDLILFATQMATTLKANIPLLKCLDIQVSQTSSRRLKSVIENIRDNVKQGRTLKDSLAKYPRIFDSMWISLVETGESSGQLPQILEHIGEYLISSNDLKRKIVTALIYPIILISVCILAIYVFTVKVIPVFAGIFNDFGMDLPPLTKIVLLISDLLRKNVLLTLITAVVMGYAAFRFAKTEKGRRTFDTLIFKIPIFGTFAQNALMERFSSCLSMLLHSGIPILNALDTLARTIGNRLVEDSLKEAYTDVREGKTLSSSLTKSRNFPPLVVSMCNVGEETGEMDKMLDQVTKYYRSELTVFTERLSAMLEPLVIVIMGGIVFVLVLAMYLPIFKLALIGGSMRGK